MDVNTLFGQINSAYRGSDDDVPVSGTPDYDLWIYTTNRKIAEWARDRKNKWRSLWENREVGTIATGTQDYELDDEILWPSDKVVITTTEGYKRYRTLIKPEERIHTYDTAYIWGRDPQTLTFETDIVSTDDIVGGTITLGGYWVPDDITSLNDTVPVDDPYWLVYAVASDLAFNDLTYESKSVDLQTKANTLYSQMAHANRAGTYDNPRTAAYNTNNIPRVSTEDRWSR